MNRIYTKDDFYNFPFSSEENYSFSDENYHTLKQNFAKSVIELINIENNKKLEISEFSINFCKSYMYHQYDILNDNNNYKIDFLFSMYLSTKEELKDKNKEAK